MITKHYKTIDSFNQKQESIRILIEIQKVCLKLRLHFYLAYGTLLGAIRHKGFIPWDDDVDIWMPRKDYEVFIKEFNNHCTPEFKLKSWHTDIDYPIIVAKVVSKRTYIEEKCFKPIEGMGIWVDIFPLDTVTKSNIKAIQEEVKLEHRRWMSLYHQSTLCSKIKLFFYNLIQKDTKFSDINLKPSYFMNLIYALSYSIEDSDKLVSPSSAVEFSKYFDAEDFKSTIDADFEGHKFPIPVGYDNILKTLYGNYMKLPPIAKQKMDKHLKKAIWLDK